MPVFSCTNWERLNIKTHPWQSGSTYARLSPEQLRLFSPLCLYVYGNHVSTFEKLLGLQRGAWITNKFSCKNACHLTRIFKPGIRLAGRTFRNPGPDLGIVVSFCLVLCSCEFVACVTFVQILSTSDSVHIRAPNIYIYIGRQKCQLAALQRIFCCGAALLAKVYTIHILLSRCYFPCGWQLSMPCNRKTPKRCGP